MTARLYSYFRSSAAWRVRIALAWKSVPVEIVPVNLRRSGGEQHLAAYRELNPQGLVPFFVDGAVAIGQSVAICEYLEERHPQPALLPADPAARARVRAMVQGIACEIHPINNLRVLQYLKRELGQDQDRIDQWVRHWIELGFAALEGDLARGPQGPYCAGESVTMADVFLVPQVANARRAGLALEAYPRILAIDSRLNALPAFSRTAPSTQADYVEP